MRAEKIQNMFQTKSEATSYQIVSNGTLTISKTSQYSVGSAKYFYYTIKEEGRNITRRDVPINLRRARKRDLRNLAHLCGHTTIPSNVKKADLLQLIDIYFE